MRTLAGIVPALALAASPFALAQAPGDIVIDTTHT